MPPSDDFQQVLAAARHGDRDAWAQLYEAHASPVLGYLRSQRAPSPEDLLGEVWLQAVRDLARFGGDESGFRSWLLTIAHHRLLDARRALSRRPAEVGGEELMEAVGASDDDASRRLEAEQELLHMLEGIPERQRSVLYMRFVLDMPQRDVAKALGISTPAMKMLQARATKSLERRIRQLRDEARPDTALPSAHTRRLG